LRVRRDHGQRGHGQRDHQSCNQHKPRTAAVYASHLHLLQRSKSSAARLPQPKTLLYPAGAEWSQPARVLHAEKQKIRQGLHLQWLDAA